MNLKYIKIFVFYFLPFLLVILITYSFLFTYNFNPTGLFLIGENFTKSPFLNSKEAIILKNEVGYDGQQFLTLAFDPFLSITFSIDSYKILCPLPYTQPEKSSLQRLQAEGSGVKT